MTKVLIWDITGLPVGIIKNQLSPGGKLPSQCTIELIDASVIPGNYRCQVGSNGTKNGKVSYDFTLKVKSQPSCGLLSVYQGSSDCGMAPSTNTISAVNYIDESNVNQVCFANFGGRRIAVTGTATCSGDSISIPVQEVAADTFINGEGTLTSSGISIHYTIRIGGMNTVCQFTINR